MKTLNIIVEFIKDDPKEFIEGVIGFGGLFFICFMLSVMGG